MQKENNTVAIIQKSIQPIAVEASSLVVKSHGDLLVATDLLTQLNIFKDKVEAEEDKITVPLEQALKVERARWKPIKGFISDSVEHLRDSMGQYQTRKSLELKAKEQVIADKLSSGELDMDEAVAKIERLKTPEKNIIGVEGDVQFREVQKLKLTDVNLIPREYLLVDEKAVLEALKQGSVVPGAEIERVQVPYNMR